MKRRALAESLLLAALAFGPLGFGCVEPWSRLALETLLLLVLLAALDRRGALLGAPAHRSLVPCLAALIALGAVQWANPAAISDPRGVAPFTASSQSTAAGVALWSCYLALVWGAARLLDGRDALRRLVWAVFLLGVFVAAVGLIQRGQGNAAIYGFRPVAPDRNPFGPYYDSDHAASLMAMSALCACGLWLSRWEGLWRPRRAGARADLWATQLLILFLIGVVALGLYAARSRGALLSLGAGGWLAALACGRLLPTRRARLTLRLALLGAAAAGLVLLLRHPRWLGHPGGVADYSTAIRLSMYRSGLRMTKDFPIFGVGRGALWAAFPYYQEAGLAGAVDHIHNDWLEVLIESGWAGLSIYLAGLALLWRQAWKAWRGSRSRELAWLGAGVAAAALAFMLHGLVDFSFQTPGNAVVFLCLQAWLGSTGFSAAEEERR